MFVCVCVCVCVCVAVGCTVLIATGITLDAAARSRSVTIATRVCLWRKLMTMLYVTFVLPYVSMEDNTISQTCCPIPPRGKFNVVTNVLPCIL